MPEIESSKPRSCQGTEKNNQHTSAGFHEALRQQKPVRMMEEMRRAEMFHWEEGSEVRYNPAEALLCAITHGHRSYAQYLLEQYGQEALAMPGIRWCSCPPAAPHLAAAVAHNRSDILALILQMVHQLPALSLYIDRCACSHMGEGKSSLHLACELSRPHAVLLLLGSGASPQIQDDNGLTALDIIMKQFQCSEARVPAKKRCLEYVLLFTPHLGCSIKDFLKEDAEGWLNVLTEALFSYLLGRNPAPLVFLALRRVLMLLHPAHFAKSLKELPIPTALKKFL